jgi:selenide,water dikinase
VTGEVDPDRVLANGGAVPGDVLLLTKAIGTGIIATALKFNRAPQAAIDAAVRTMTTLNRTAAEAIVPHGASVHACTDITGFGVIGHASEMAASSRCSLEIDAARVPLIDGARALVNGNIPGGGRTNREHFGPGVAAAQGLPAELLDLLYDPQTSGGLLLAVDPAGADAVRTALEAAGVPAVLIGRALPAAGAAILIV